MAVLQQVGTLVVDPDEPLGEKAYLQEYDPEAHDGMGFVLWTDSIEQALLFDDPAAHWALWRRVPQNRPLRDDGLPNRPLTAFTIEVIPVEVA